MIYTDLNEFKQHLQKNSRLICLDYGTKKTGIATSDRSLSISSPYDTIVTSSYNQLEHDLGKILQETKPWGIVIGYPITLDNRIGKACHRVRAFANRIYSSFKLPILLADERNTTKIANEILQDLDLKRHKRHKIDDKIVASIILEMVLKKIYQ